MLKSSFVALSRSKKALLLVLLGVLSIATSAILYRLYVNRTTETAKAAKERLDQQVQATLKKERENLKFIENKGQWPSEVLFGLESATGHVWIRKDDVVFRATVKKEDESEQAEKAEVPGVGGEKETYQAHTWKMSLAGRNPNFEVSRGEGQPTIFSYYGPSQNTTTGVLSYKEVTLKGVYPGIDLRFYSGDKSQIEYDFIVAPGADFRQIKLDYEGQDSLKVAEDKSLEIGLRFGSVKVLIPEAYQVKDGKKQMVEVAFDVDGNRATFEPMSPIDSSLPLVVDPTLLWGTYFDENTTSFDAYAYASKAALCGEVFVGGWMDEGLSSTGTLQVESTPVVGTITQSGNITVTVTATGMTGSPIALSVPVIIGNTADEVARRIRAAMTLSSGITAKFSIGGTANSIRLTQLSPAIANDGSLNIAIANGTALGLTADATSDNTTAGVAGTGKYLATGYDTSFTANRQGALYKFNATGTDLLALTFFGGGITGDLEHSSTFIDLDVFPDGRVIAVGRTQGTITTVSPYQSSKGSGNATDVTGMIAIFDSSLQSLLYASYLGGGTLAADKETNVVRSVTVLDNTTYFVGGVMTGTPVVGGFANGPDTTTAGNEGYVARFSNGGTRDWATFVGGDNSDDIFSIGLTHDGSKVVFAGDSDGNTNGFPTLVNAVDSTKNSTEVFVGYLNSAASVPGGFGLLSYIGGTGIDQKPLVDADDTNLFVAGSTVATNVPGAINSNAGGYDIFVSRIPLTGGANNVITRYLGGSGDDTAGGIITTKQNEVLVFGTSTDATTDYPVQNTAPATNFYDGSHGGGLDIVWTYLSYDLSSLTFSTFIGGARNDYLGDTGILAGSGHIGYNEVTGVVTLATTSHSETLTSVMTAGSFDPTMTGGSNSKDNHIILKFSSEVNDFGDAPLAYDLDAASAARHGVDNSVPRFGSLVDIDASVQSGPFALTDDLVSTTSPCSFGGDDEDGLTVTPLSCSQVFPIANYTLTVNATSPSGSASNIYAWIDLNADGFFSGAEAATGTPFSLAANTTSNVNRVWASLPTPPINSFTGANGMRGYYVRFRITTQTLTNSNSGNTALVDTRSRGQATNGEVEDYFIPFEDTDWGDAPDTYGTTSGANGPRHRIRTGLYIGSASPATDRECNGTDSLATADDASGDDETALGTLSIGTTATSATIPIPVTNSTGSAAVLCGWIDWNRDGDFTDQGGPNNVEGTCVAVPNGTAGTVNLTWTSLTGLTAGPSYLRLRLSTDASLTASTPTGALSGVADGEVEDHPLTISNVTAVDLAGFKAYQLGDSVFLNWRTGFEADNLGFNVYRDLDGQRRVVTPSLIAGSALMVGSGIRLEAGLSYGWRDDAGKRGQRAEYWLEEVDLSGATRMHGPFSVESAEMMPITQRVQIALQPRALRLNELTDRVGEMGGSHEIEPSAELVFSDENAPARITNVSAGTRIPAQTKNMDLSGQAALKIEVNKAGWYHVGQPELIAAGLGKVDPRNLQLYAEGKQIPIRITGEQDGSFDSGDAIEFYGVGLDAPSTDTRVYWLMASRLRGQRMPSSGAGGGGSPPPSFTHTVVRKDRLVYVSAVLNGPAENFFGAPIAGLNPTVTQTLSTPNLFTGGGESSAELEVAIQGVSTHEHVVRVSLNGTTLGSINFKSQQKGVKTFNIAQTLLVAGDNQVKLERESAEPDVTLVDSLKLTYQHAWKATGNAVTVSAQPGDQVAIGGFTSANVRIIDITDVDSPVELNSEVTGQQAPFSVSAAVTGQGTRRLYAFAADQVRAAASIKVNVPSAWKSTNNRANFVIIAHSSLIPGIVPLAELRRSQGWNVAIVDVDDLYDEFSYGSKTPEAIADFLQLAATTWKVKPQAVLLVGKATYDPRFYTGQGDVDLVPTQMVETQMMECAVDDALADFNADGVPELAVGRLPVRNAAEAAAMVKKIIAYEGSQPSNRVALVSDVSDTYSFDDVNNMLKATMPPGVDVQTISRGLLGDTTRTKVLEELDRAHRIVNYVGHGSIQLWRGDVLTVNDAASLQKGNELSLFVMMTCLNGYFISPMAESLSESLLRSGGGAVATWASSGTTTPEGQQAMNVAAFQQLFGGQNLTIGEAARRAKAAVGEPDVRRTWNLLGDPTMRLK